MKIYSSRHQKALNLVDKLQNVSNKLEKYVDSQVKKQTDSDAIFNKKFNSLSKKEDEAYQMYFNHMNKDFSRKQIEDAISSNKYKNKFIDKKLINDLYKNNAKKVNYGKKKTNSKVK